MMDVDDEIRAEGPASAKNVISLPATRLAKHFDIAASSMNTLSKLVATLVARLSDVDHIINALPDSATRASLITSCDEQRRALIAASSQLHEQLVRLPCVDRRSAAAFPLLRK